jgi:hypothetical protein
MNARRALFDERLLQRVYSEFLEMPGMRLTCQQAQRLWGLDSGTCLELLEFLVEARFLCRPDHGMYARLTEGRDTRPRFRGSSAGTGEDLRPRKTKAV